MKESPCKFDHNGECLVCRAWPSGCEFKRLIELASRLRDMRAVYSRSDPKWETLALAAQQLEQDAAALK